MLTHTIASSRPLLSRIAERKLKEIKQEKTWLTFRQFVNLVNPKYQWYEHVTRLADVLERVISGDIKRLMIFMPPRHGKSELVSRLFTAYYLYRFPDRFVGINSYAAELAYTFSRTARDNFQRAGGVIRDDAGAVKHWETLDGGGLWAAGVGGPITGKGFHLGLIDDPIKNSEEAASETIRDKQNEWYDSTFYTREEPDAAIIVIQTRWHEADLSGYLLSKEDEEPENWHIVHFEAIKEDETPEYPPSCTLEPDFRKPGEALAPLRYPLDKLKKIARRIGSYFWNALFQQRPRAREGNMFHRAWFEIVKATPAKATRARYWDKAGTADGGKRTAGVLMAKADGVYYIEDVVKGQWAAAEREKVILQTAQTDRQTYGNVTIYTEQEPGSGGKESAEATIKRLAGFTVYADRVTGDKVVRAEPMAAQAQAGNVKMLEGLWNKDFIDEFIAFPKSTFKDQVDASSGAFNKLTGQWRDIPFDKV